MDQRRVQLQLPLVRDSFKYCEDYYKDEDNEKNMEQCDAGMGEVEAVTEAETSESEAERSEMGESSSQSWQPL
eukprot:15455742-Alexandrium_andersonii.AAC.1